MTSCSAVTARASSRLSLASFWRSRDVQRERSRTRPMIDLRYVKKLVELLDGSSVDSIEISSDKGMKIRISKTPQQRGTVQVAPSLPIPAMIPAPAVVPPRVAPGETSAAGGEAAARAQAP